VSSRLLDAKDLSSRTHHCISRLGVKVTTCKAKAKAKDLASEAKAKAEDLTFKAKGLIPEATVWPTIKITSLKNWNWLRQTKLFFCILFYVRSQRKSIGSLKVKKDVGHMTPICLFSWVRPVSISTYAAALPVIITLFSAWSQMLIALQEYEVRQHLVPT